ncbi:MAG TPA: ester cyclase [Burkholderiales bacterium]|nr:ester cyclase [Burkholderiales bacterium]
MGKKLITDLYRLWSQDDVSAISSLVAEQYTIFSDPGDAWEGKTLTRDEYRNRFLYSRKAFPDLVFETGQFVHDGGHVAVAWNASGTHLGDLEGLPATGKKLSFSGQTIYLVLDGLVAGHWQTIDRLGFIQQLRP